MVLASASTDGMLKLWDLVSRRVCVELNEHGGRGIIGLAWLAESAQLISQGRDGCIRVWNVRAKFGRQDDLQLELDVAFVMNHRSYTFTRMSYMAAATGGLLLAPAANDTFFEIWDTLSGTALVAHCVARKEGGKTGMVMSLKLVVLQGVDFFRGMGQAMEKEVAHFGTKIGNCASTLETVQRSMESCNPANNTQHGAIPKNQGQVAVIVGVESGEIGLFVNVTDTTGGIPVKPNSSPDNAGMETHVESPILGLTGDDALWLLAHEDPVLCLDATVRRSNQSSLIGVSGGADASISVFTIQMKDDQYSFTDTTKISMKNRGVADIRLRPDGRIFAAACWDGNVRIYGVKKCRQLAVLRFHNAGVHAVAFPACGTPAVDAGMVVSASKDARIAVWGIFPPAKK
eukprot:g3626.t1